MATTVSKVCLALCAMFSIMAGYTAATLQWPDDLVTVSTGKSLQALPVSAEAASNLNAPMDEQELSNDNGSVKSQDQQQILSAANAAESHHAAVTPVAVPLPLIVAARPGLRTVLTVQQPTVARVGELVQHVPSAISHQSQTIVHDHKRLVTPIVAPALRTTQLVHQQQPVVWTLGEPRVLVLNH